MTDDRTKLDSRLHTFDRCDHLPSSNKPRFTGPPARPLTLQRCAHLVIRYGRSHHETFLLILLPTLYFRLFPLILTHNSFTLSLYLALALVYIPIKVIVLPWRIYSPLFRTSSRRRGARQHEAFLSSFSESASPNLGRTTATDRGGIHMAQLFVWLCGAAFTLWVYTLGISPSFPTASSVIASSPTLRAQQSRNASYFIAASLFNNEEILASWSSEMLQLIDSLGRANVYVSLTENDSEDNTASKLLHFSSKLRRRNISHSLNITSGIRGYPADSPWKSVEHRMSYMANLRNGALEPLGRLDTRFDNVILLNDVLYHHTDVLKLIAAVGGDDLKGDGRGGVTSETRQRRRMACSLDMDGATLYDTWVLRDRCGLPVSGFWPFFTSQHDGASVRKGRVLDVGTCWNGIVVLDGDMLLHPRLRSRDADWVADTLRFQQPPNCIISECALLPLNIVNATGGSPIVVDPTVVVAYTPKWWKYYAVWLRMPVVRLWMSLFEEAYWGLWWNMGLGKVLVWKGLDDGKEKDECLVEGWPKCGGRQAPVEKGSLRLRRPDEL